MIPGGLGWAGGGASESFQVWELDSGRVRAPGLRLESLGLGLMGEHIGMGWGWQI